MTRAEFIDEEFNLPRPGAPPIDNLIATLLLQKNRTRWLDLDRIADAQGFDRAELSARFAHLETAFDRQLTKVSLVPSNSFDMEGK